MNMKVCFLMILMSLFIVNCGTSTSKVGTNEKTVIAVTLQPQKYFVERITGDKFEVLVMIPPGHNAATYSPTPQQMRAISLARLYLKNGQVLFEASWLNNFVSNNQSLKVVDTSVGVDYLKGTHDEHDGHGHEGHISDGDPKTGIDPHFWMSPKAVKIQAKNILDAVIGIDEKNKAFYEKNYQNFMSDIDRLDNDIKSMLSKTMGKKFMVFHPAWSYFARDYGLIQISIEGEGKSPSPAALKDVINLAKSEGIHIIFIQKQFDTNLARSVADEIQGKVVIMDPLAEDWLDNMRRTAQVLSESLK